jgi:DNA primase
MGIVDEDVVRVREASDIVALVTQHTALRKVGQRFTGLCPFHAEKSPSFSVNAEENLYYCFGCQAKGDVITFVRETEHVDFVGAVEFLAHKAGITLRYTDKVEGEGRKRRARLVAAVAEAVEWYHTRLLSGDDAARARGYLRSRGLDGEQVRQYKIGWAPDSWDALAKALRLPDDVFVDAGLGFLNKRGRPTDAFRGRVLFPIYDLQGDPVAFGGRILPDGEGPKYKNSAESAIYAKSKTLYGLHWMKASIVEADEAIVCEGYTDVIGFAAAGLPRAVATCGTALTEEHVRVLKRFAGRVVIAFDADSAGQAAAERFYEWEKAYDIEVAVADLPNGVDPADLARTDPPALRKAVEHAKPFLGFRVDRVLNQASMSSPERRARAAEAALAVIAEHPSDFVRDQYVMQVADRCQVDADRLRAALRDGSARVTSGPRTRRPDEAAPRRSGPLRESPETEALKLAVHRPDEVAELLDDILFESELHAAAFRALAVAATLPEAIDAADPAAADLLQRLAVEETSADATDVVARLADEAAQRQLARVESEMRRSDDALALNDEVRFLKLNIEGLREPVTAAGAVGELVAWLRDRDAQRDQREGGG